MYKVPQKVSSKKLIEIGVLVFLIVWGCIFAYDYIRYSHGDKPMFAVCKTIDKYKDGTVDECYGIGYVYRAYNRVVLSDEEFGPFWLPRRNPPAENDLPSIEYGYNVPENPRHLDKYMGLLYFYDKERDLLDTYKCIHSSLDCMKATGGWDDYNTVNKNPLTKLEEPHTMAIMYDKFAWVDDSTIQDIKYGDNGYSRIIYLFQFKTGKSESDKGKILARYADIKESTYDEFKDLADGENHRYIVQNKDNLKWGLIKVNESGSIDEVLPFEYESISYDIDTKYYILCKDKNWYIYDLNNEKVVSAESVDPIYDVWRNHNNTFYFKTGRDRTIGSETIIDYKIYRIDGKEFLNIDKVTSIDERASYVMYVTSEDNKLHFIDYGKNEKYTVQLYFSNLNHNNLSHPAYEIHNENENIIFLYVYKGRELKYDYESVSVFTNKWDLNGS